MDLVTKKATSSFIVACDYSDVMKDNDSIVSVESSSTDRDGVDNTNEVLEFALILETDIVAWKYKSGNTNRRSFVTIVAVTASDQRFGLELPLLVEDIA